MITYLQGLNDNTCGLIACINALSYNNQQIPHKNKLINLVKKYNLEYGATRQDMYCLANEFRLNLNATQNEKEVFIKLLKNDIPLIISCGLHVNNNKINELMTYKRINFNLLPIKIKIFDKNLLNNKKLLNNKTCTFHSFLITKYNKKIDSFLCHNVFDGSYWLNFSDFIFDTPFSSFFITKNNIKITGIPTLRN